MPWSKVECFRSALGLPTDVQASQLGRADIPAWTQALGAFYPDLAIAEEKDLLQAQIYEQQASLRAEPDTEERALYVLLLRSVDQLIGGIVVEYDEVEQTVVGRMSVVAPSWRGRGLGRVLLRAQEALGHGVSLIPPEQAQWPAADQLPPVLAALMQFVQGQSRR